MGESRVERNLYLRRVYAKLPKTLLPEALLALTANVNSELLTTKTPVLNILKVIPPAVYVCPSEIKKVSPYPGTEV